MKGTIIGYSVKENVGFVNSSEDERYKFSGEDWMSPSLPEIGMKVDFVVGAAGEASEVFKDVEPTKKSVGEPAKQYQAKDGLYRIQDDAVWGGVCSGLAHKWGMNRDALRLITVFATVLFFPLFFVYCAFWAVLPDIEG